MTDWKRIKELVKRASTLSYSDKRSPEAREKRKIRKRMKKNHLKELV